MDAFQVCDLLVSQVKSSSLNFSLQELPFSIQISIKKSFIKYKNSEYTSGRIHTSLDNPFLLSDTNLEDENKELKEHLENFKSEKMLLENSLHDLSIKLEKAKVEISELLLKNKTLDKTRKAIEEKLNENENEAIKLKYKLEETKQKEIELGHELFEAEGRIKIEAEASNDLVDSLKNDLEVSTEILKSKEIENSSLKNTCKQLKENLKKL